MRRLIIVVALTLLVGAGVYQFLTSQQGYLVLSIGNYVVETTLWGALVVVVLLMLSGYLLYRVWKIVALPRRWWRYRLNRKQVKVRNRTAQGVIDYLEGNWPKAFDNLKGSIKHSEMPAVSYLGAAAASFNLGNETDCKALITGAEENGVLDTITGGGLLRARLMLQNREFDKALALVETLHRKSPSHPTVLRLMVAARKGIGDWHGLETLFIDLKKHHALSSKELEDLEQETYGQIIQSFAVNKTANKSLSEQQTELDHLWDSIPRKLHKKPDLITAYIRQLQALGLPEKAETRLRRIINGEWDDGLAKVYGEINADAERQLRIAEAWLKKQPDNPFLLETLGRLCVRCELWGKGKEYFEMCLKKNPHPSVWLALGDLMRILQDTKASSECYRNGLQNAVSPGASTTG